MVYNAKIIDYGDYLHIQYYDRPIKKNDVPEGIKEVIKENEKECIINDSQEPKEFSDDLERINHCINSSVNRSKINLYRIARSNEWDLFITLTFDQKKIDSSDYALVSDCVTKWLEKMRRKHKDFKYLIVPEFHSDKIHYHFHGLLANCSFLDLQPSGKRDKEGAMIYNITDWSEEYGFTTAMYVKDQAAVRNYIGKYITKDLMNRLKYKKRYYASKNVKICDEQFYNISYDDLLYWFAPDISYIKTVNVNGVNRIKYIEVKKEKPLDF